MLENRSLVGFWSDLEEKRFQREFLIGKFNLIINDIETRLMINIQWAGEVENVHLIIF